MRDDVEPAGDLLGGDGEELVGLGPVAAGGRERADERGVGREVSDVDGELAQVDELGELAVERWAEPDAVEAREVGLELLPMVA